MAVNFSIRSSVSRPLHRSYHIPNDKKTRSTQILIDTDRISDKLSLTYKAHQ